MNYTWRLLFGRVPCFFFVPKAKLELKGKNVDDLSKIFRSTIKTKARHPTRKKTLGGGKKKEEN